MSNLAFIGRTRITGVLTLLKVYLIAIGFFSGSISYALQAPLPKVLTLYDGQSRAYGVSGAIRVTVGDTSLISATMLKTGDIIAAGVTVGNTDAATVDRELMQGGADAQYIVPKIVDFIGGGTGKDGIITVQKVPLQ